MEDKMKTICFQRIAAYDSKQDGDVVIEFPNELQWKMRVEHVRFEMPVGEVWTHPIGYLKIYSDSSQFIGTVVTNGGVRMRDNALPIMYPDQAGRPTAIGTFRGVSNGGPVGFHFAVLGDDKKKIEMGRIIVIFTIFAEDGK
jgi:hypothetical protein